MVVGEKIFTLVFEYVTCHVRTAEQWKDWNHQPNALHCSVPRNLRGGLNELIESKRRAATWKDNNDIDVRGVKTRMSTSQTDPHQHFKCHSKLFLVSAPYSRALGVHLEGRRHRQFSTRHLVEVEIVSLVSSARRSANQLGYCPALSLHRPKRLCHHHVQKRWQDPAFTLPVPVLNHWSCCIHSKKSSNAAL